MKHQRALRIARLPWVSAAFLIALLAHALVPAGFMPGPEGLMLCPAFGISVALDPAMDDMPGMDMSGHDQSPSKDDHSSHRDFAGICPFAAAAFACAGPPTGSLFARLDRIAAWSAFRAAAIRPQQTFFLSPLPRGPPSFL